MKKEELVRPAITGDVPSDLIPQTEEQWRSFIIGLANGTLKSTAFNSDLMMEHTRTCEACAVAYYEATKTLRQEVIEDLLSN